MYMYNNFDIEIKTHNQVCLLQHYIWILWRLNMWYMYMTDDD